MRGWFALTLILLGVGGGCLCGENLRSTSTPTGLTRVGRPNPIVSENQQPGDSKWRSGARASNRELEVYASSESVAHGDILGVKVSTDTNASVTADIYRMGHYGGAGARKVWSGGPWNTTRQAECPRDPVTSLVACDWSDTFAVTIDPSWVSGLYLVKVHREGFKRFYPFVIRDDRAAEILFTPNFTTYQAYNTWGGESLYYDGSGTMPSGRAWAVSFNRPYEAVDGAGKTFDLDVELVQLLEQHGYDVTYGSNIDFLRFPNFLEGIGAFVHGGQDEYWSPEERHQVDAALESGHTSLAYFGGNGGYWRVRFEPDAQGRPLRTMHCYKSEPLQDPIPYSTVRFRDPPDARPENNLFGVMYEGFQLVPFPLVVGNPTHWLFEGTGLTQGTLLVDLVGFEYDHAFEMLPGYPSGVTRSMTSPVVSAEGIPSVAHTVDRTLPGGTLVFAAGTIWWARALSDDPEVRDERVARMTLNVLERALAHRRPPRTRAPSNTSGPAQPAPHPSWFRSVQPFAGVATHAGLEDGPAATASFRAPTGLAANVAGDVFVADTGNNRLRMISGGPDRMVSTIAGTGDLGYRDGEGSQALFRIPTDVAVGPAGELYVADSDNHVIRRLDRVSAGWTVSTVAGKGFSAGYADGASATARFNRPIAIEVDAGANIYVADQGNARIRRIDGRTHTVSTIAGTGDLGDDDAPVGTAATFNNPTALALGSRGEIYVWDGGNQLLRAISADPTRRVSTVAGQRAPGYVDGPGTQARFRAQMGLLFLPPDLVLVADTANFRIRKITLPQRGAPVEVFTAAGTGKVGSETGPADRADIVSPAGLALGPAGQIYVSDPYNHVIREIIP